MATNKKKGGIPNNYTDATEASHIYVLPNLMTAGNLLCGFLAVIRCIQAKFAESMRISDDIVKEALLPEALYEQAVWFILGAVIFDFLDGLLARLSGRESLFGKEFDSIADIVSFGMAPALMVFFLILSPTEEFPFFRQLGGLVGFIYLLCGAVRLARHNVITHPLIDHKKGAANEDFQGLPVPAAAGMIASLVLVINSYNLKDGAIFLPILLLLIAFLMVSNIRYPSFKTIDWNTQAKSRTFISFLCGLALIYHFRWFAVAIMFIAYIFYGLLRFIREEWLSHKHGS